MNIYLSRRRISLLIRFMMLFNQNVAYVCVHVVVTLFMFYFAV